ncbi:MAG TPA: TIGR02452 family protein [Alphaproteobacteria bacterium]|nr:TIGR02452 family protein [Alphaproteobacteria bacterium]
MNFKSKAFFASLLIGSALYCVPAQAMEGQKDEVQSHLAKFSRVNSRTLPTLLEGARRKDSKALKKLVHFSKDLEALKRSGYVSKNSNTDKTISHIRSFFEDHGREIKTLKNLSYFSHITPDTIPALLDQARIGDITAIKSLRKFEGSIRDLTQLQYEPPNHGIGRAVRGVKKTLDDNQAELMNLYKKLGTTTLSSPQSSSDLVAVASRHTFASATPKDRTDIFSQNKNIAQNGYVIDGEFVEVDTAQSIKGTKVYGRRDDQYIPNQGLRNISHSQTQVVVVNADTVDHALLMKEMGFNPLVLDMANAVSPGGAAHNGKGNAQEEKICYRSNLHDPLHTFSDKAKRGKSKNFIPKEGGLYIPNVTIFREGAGNGYKFMKKPETIAFGAIAAYRHKSRLQQRKIVDETYYPELKSEENYWNSTKRKLYSFFDMALENGHDSLVLSAFGCGAFKNPPENMVEVFKEVLSEYAGCFKEIHFAIYASKPGDRNLKLFEEAFSGRTY